LRDVLALQSEVAQAIAREVKIKLNPQEQADFARVRPVHPEAYDAYLHGRYHWNRRSGEALPTAILCFQQAIAKDPEYSAAYSGLADCLSVLGYWGLVAPGDGCGKAKGIAEKALQLDPGLAEVHSSLAFAVMFHDFDFARAEREFERCIELNPRYATAHQWLGLSLGMIGRYEEGVAEVKRAIRLDPHSVTYLILGTIFFFVSRHYDRAVEQFKRAIESNVSFAQAYSLLGLAYAHMSMQDCAIAAAEKGVELGRGTPFFLGFLGDVCAATGHRDQAQAILTQLQDLAGKQYVTPYAIGALCAGLNAKEEAFGWLESAFRVRDPLLVCVKTDPRFDSLHSDARFGDLLRRMNFPPS